MSERVVCDHCGKKTTGFNNWSNYIGDLLLCSKCYERLAPFSVRNKYETVEEIETARVALMKRMDEEDYEIEHKDLASKFLDRKKRILIHGVDTEAQGASRKIFDQAVARGDYKELIKTHMNTSGYNFEGHTIEEYYGVVTGEVVLGTGFFSGFSAGFADMLGVESEAYRSKLQESRKLALERVILESIYLGGNAVIGVDIDYVIFSGDLIGIIANGTSVKLSKVNKD